MLLGFCSTASSSLRSCCSVRWRSVMSANDTTAPVKTPVTGSLTGTEFTRCHRTAPGTRASPSTTSWEALPVLKVMATGNSWTGITLPSGRTGVQSDKAFLLPCMSARVIPRIRSAEGLQLSTEPSALKVITPSRKVDTVVR
jgi:hypothetical protein